jgi:SAM-dependent methyltransferase
MTLRRFVLTSAAILLGAAAFAVTPLGRDLLFHVLPVNWTGEAERLAAALDIRGGSIVADLGAGSGALAVELAKLTGQEGGTFASERTPAQRRAISDRAGRAGQRVTVVEAGDQSTNLPDSCCDAITMRMVMHHVNDPAMFVRDLRRSLRAGGRVGVVDFAPGVMPHLRHDHGVDPRTVVDAFSAAGFTTIIRDDQWGGRTYLMVFRAP